MDLVLLGQPQVAATVRFEKYGTRTFQYFFEMEVTCSHLQPLAATCSHLQPFEWPQVAAPQRYEQVAASGRKWPQVAASGRWTKVGASGRKWPQVASGRKWPQVAASGRWTKVGASGRKWPQVAAFPKIKNRTQSNPSKRYCILQGFGSVWMLLLTLGF